jgi:hypothetical protein
MKELLEARNTNQPSCANSNGWLELSGSRKPVDSLG